MRDSVALLRSAEVKSQGHSHSHGVSMVRWQRGRSGTCSALPRVAQKCPFFDFRVLGSQGSRFFVLGHVGRVLGQNRVGNEWAMGGKSGKARGRRGDRRGGVDSTRVADELGSMQLSRFGRARVGRRGLQDGDGSEQGTGEEQARFSGHARGPKPIPGNRSCVGGHPTGRGETTHPRQWRSIIVADFGTSVKRALRKGVTPARWLKQARCCNIPLRGA